jgi:hypothetical protein
MNTLSHASRRTLALSILQALPVYYMGGVIPAKNYYQATIGYHSQVFLG